jgi:hypothetical protein
MFKPRNPSQGLLAWLVKVAIEIIDHENPDKK